ncbi:hypothetical protein BBJ29_007895 [Phytophthora kernoviae]|uniref:RxLR effector protein n=1 Tax=Phytophthora kernoviae TaxID=325452 RepID=A0A3F2RT48_9STRA|nr:hypothetical protein BBJ29_007895 [Phytophthora kernoviae]RLN63754.1 hypothetical protein BBP00_00003886 [Phytophthora kernoviae]
MKAFFLGIASALVAVATAVYAPEHVAPADPPESISDGTRRLEGEKQEWHGLGDIGGIGGLGGLGGVGDLGGIALRGLSDEALADDAEKIGDDEAVYARGHVATGGVAVTPPRRRWYN